MTTWPVIITVISSSCHVILFTQNWIQFELRRCFRTRETSCTCISHFLSFVILFAFFFAFDLWTVPHTPGMLIVLDLIQDQSILSTAGTPDCCQLHLINWKVGANTWFDGFTDHSISSPFCFHKLNNDFLKTGHVHWRHHSQGLRISVNVLFKYIDE